MPEYVTFRRWSLREGADEAALTALVREEIIPAYKRAGGVIVQELVRAGDPPSYLAVTVWRDRAAYDTWAGPGGQQWRDEHRRTLERWLDMMSFQDEMEGDLLVTSA